MAEALPKNAPELTEKVRRREAVIAALERLSIDDMRKLRRYAAFKSLQMHGTVLHWDADDLLQDAIARTLSGRRKWNEAEVEFFVHILGTIRSIASQCRREAERDSLYRQEQQYKDATSDASESRPRIRSVNARTLSEDTLATVRLCLAGEKVALPVYEHLREGYTPAEIQELLGISVKIYNAARKRIYRCIKALI